MQLNLRNNRDSLIECFEWFSHIYSVCQIPYSLLIKYYFRQPGKHYSCVLYVASSVDGKRQTLLIPRPEVQGKDSLSLFFNCQSAFQIQWQSSVVVKKNIFPENLQLEVKGCEIVCKNIPTSSRLLKVHMNREVVSRRKDWF